MADDAKASAPSEEALECAKRLLDDERFKRCFQWWPVNVTDYTAGSVVAEHIARAIAAEREAWIALVAEHLNGRFLNVRAFIAAAARRGEG